jgi:hypothetical protein
VDDNVFGGLSNSLVARFCREYEHGILDEHDG